MRRSMSTSNSMRLMLRPRLCWSASDVDHRGDGVRPFTASARPETQYLDDMVAAPFKGRGDRPASHSCADLVPRCSISRNDLELQPAVPTACAVTSSTYSPVTMKIAPGQFRVELFDEEVESIDLHARPPDRPKILQKLPRDDDLRRSLITSPRARLCNGCH